MMGVGVRIRQARRMAGLSLRALAGQAGVSAQAISKYERELDMPSSGVLVRLARALGVQVEFFLRAQRAEVLVPSAEASVCWRTKRQRSALARIQDWLERYLEIESLAATDNTCLAMPQSFPRGVGSLPEVEDAAMALRCSWDLGAGPIENLVELLEGHGIKVSDIGAGIACDAATLILEPASFGPLMIVRRSLPRDRQRLALAHELGHILLRSSDGLDDEKLADRFSRAFLAPEPSVRHDLGTQRHALEPRELQLLSQKYGIDARAWICRARELCILAPADARRMLKRVTRSGMGKAEPGIGDEPERSSRMERLVLRALAEGAISEPRAAELLGSSFAAFRAKDAGGQRSSIASSAASALRDEPP